MTVETFLRIKDILDKSRVDYKHLMHEHVSTSEDAAKIRGTNLADAAKAIILKVQNKDGSFSFVQAVIPANERIDLKKLKIILGTKNVALASPQEVVENTNCTIGSVPPFASVLFNIPIYMDDSVLQKDFIVFSAGTHNDSIEMKAQDYLVVVDPRVCEFKKEK
jgi:Ala-tRNA(Pro) deacylase